LLTDKGNGTGDSPPKSLLVKNAERKNRTREVVREATGKKQQRGGWEHQVLTNSTGKKEKRE